MAKQITPFPYTTVLGIDIQRGALHYYNVLGDNVDSVVHNVQKYSSKYMDEEFFQKLTEAMAKFVENEPSETVRKVAFIFPDEAVALDNVRLPILRSQRLIQNSLNTKLKDIYLNYDNLNINTHLAEKNRQYCTYNVVAIQEKVLNALCSACSSNKMLADVLTFASASTVNAVSTLNPKWKNENYLFLDIKDVYSRFIFVVGGRAVGFYSLPFGSEFLSSRKCIPEDMLFDHTMSELTVLNARERAKSKKLSVLDEEDIEQTIGEMTESIKLDAMLVTNNNWDSNETEKMQKKVSPKLVESSVIKVMPKKQPRKLPSFMQRPVPETREEVENENFRVFAKWALSLIQSNPKLTSFGAPKFICVNLPKEYAHVIDAINKEEEENGVSFVRFDFADDNEDLARNLELFGGLYANNLHYSAKF